MRTTTNFIKNSKYVVLLIGVSRYDSARGLHDILNVEANINMMYDLFRDKRYIGVSEKNIIVSLNDDAKTINKKLTDASEKAKNSDYTLFVYYSGHGIISPANYNLYFATSDVEDKYLEDSAINAKSLLDKVNRSVASRKVLVVDACHSGQIHNTMGDVNSAVAGLMNNYEGVHYVSACDESSSALFNKRTPDVPTYFTGAIIDRVRSGMETDRPYLTLREIVDDIRIDFKGRKNMPVPQQSSVLNADQMPFAMNVASSADFSAEELQKNFYHTKIVDNKTVMSNNISDNSKDGKNGTQNASGNVTNNNDANMTNVSTINVNNKSAFGKTMFYISGLMVLFMLVFSNKLNTPGSDTDNYVVVAKIDSDTVKKATIATNKPAVALTSSEYVNKTYEAQADELLAKGGEEYYAVIVELYDKALVQNSDNQEAIRKRSEVMQKIESLYSKYMDDADFFAKTDSKLGYNDAIMRVKKALALKKNDSAALDALQTYEEALKNF